MPKEAGVKMNETSLSNLLINAMLTQKLSSVDTNNAHQSEQSGHQAPADRQDHHRYRKGS